MSAITIKGELADVIAAMRAVAEDAEREFGSMNAEQLNWKPSAEQWSVAQCFDHLINANQSYFALLDRLAKGEHRATFFERLPFAPKIFGKLVLNAVKPEAKRKLKAPQKIQPAASRIDADIIKRFRAHQRDLIERIRELENHDPSRIVITSPVASFVTYTLMDGFRIIAAHENRHFAQAQRVKAAMSK